MHKLAKIISLALLLLLAGCIPSVHPLYTPKDLIFDPALLGVWVDKEGKDTWTFSKGSEKGYDATLLDEKGEKGAFVVHLLKVKDRQYLDFYPESPDLSANSFYKAHLFPVHTFMRIERDGEELQLAYLKPDWLEKFLKKQPGAIRHEIVEDTELLTASPKELQAFLIEHDKTPGAWDNCSPMTRKASQPAQ